LFFIFPFFFSLFFTLFFSSIFSLLKNTCLNVSFIIYTLMIRQVFYDLLWCFRD
jgi:hypothetical protein